MPSGRSASARRPGSTTPGWERRIESRWSGSTDPRDLGAHPTRLAALSGGGSAGSPVDRSEAGKGLLVRRAQTPSGDGATRRRSAPRGDAAMHGGGAGTMLPSGRRRPSLLRERVRVNPFTSGHRGSTSCALGSWLTVHLRGEQRTSCGHALRRMTFDPACRGERGRPWTRLRPQPRRLEGGAGHAA